jgi:hypothetical protein
MHTSPHRRDHEECWSCEMDVSPLHMGLCSRLEWPVLALAQNDGGQQPQRVKQMQQIDTPRSIVQELAHLTKDLELTPKQQQQVRPLLQEHRDKIQALLDKNPNASRQELASDSRYQRRNAPRN